MQMVMHMAVVLAELTVTTVIMHPDTEEAMAPEAPEAQGAVPVVVTGTVVMLMAVIMEIPVETDNPELREQMVQ